MTDQPVDFEYRLPCPCGAALCGGTEAEIVEVAYAHLRAEHPELADGYAREHILFMAIKLRV